MVLFRNAADEDVAAIVQMLADDPLGSQREHFMLPLPASYLKAFKAINDDPNNELIVAYDETMILGVMQLTFIPYLTYQGGWRALIEGVRVNKAARSQGIGQQMFEYGIERARARGCHVVQLTTDKARPDALRFYQKLGFVASHEGLKLHLNK